MIPILYTPEETSFTTNGIGRLSDCIECTVTEERNGIYECQFRYPITGIHYSDIKEGCIIAVIHDDRKDIQPFDIYSRSAPINGIVTFYARHISYRLSNVILEPFTASTCAQAMAMMVPKSMNNNPFTFWTDKEVSGTFAVKTPTSVKAKLGGEQGSILDAYGTAEYEWDKWSVKLYLHRGGDSGVEIRYGKNLTDITQEINAGETYSVVVPYWSDPDGGTCVMLPERFVTADSVTQRYANWQDHRRVDIRSRSGEILQFRYSVYTAVPMDLSEAFEEVPTQEQLRAEAKRRLENSKAWLSDENIELDFVQLWQTEEYKNIAPLQRVSLCDTVSVFYPALGVNAVKMQVIKVKYNVLTERYDSMELGSPKTSFAQVVAADTREYVERNAVSVSTLERAINAATALISGAVGGYRVEIYNANGQPVETLYMDTDDINTAVNVIRINKNGIAFSNEGYNPEKFVTAWTIDGGFVADFITAGTLSANRISGGILSSDISGNYWNLVTGELWSGSNDRAAALIDGYLYLYNKNVQEGYIGRVSAVSENLNVVTGGKALALSRLNSNGVSQTILMIRNGETGTGYSDDAVAWGVWRFLGQVYHAAAVHLGSNTFSPFTSGSSHGFRTDSSDFVLIGTNALLTSYLLRVGGSAYIDATLSAQTVTQRSDERLKDISAWDDRYTEVLDELEPIVYRWKDGKDDLEYVGIGAQKTRRILDEYGLGDSGLVQGEPDELTVSYSDLTCMLLKKVQEQQKQIERLEQRLARLEASICL